MGTTTETRITSTQAKDAIYKAHSISSSASEIDDTVDKISNTSKTLLKVGDARKFTESLRALQVYGLTYFKREEFEAGHIRPVGWSYQYFINPKVKPSQATDFHGMDIYGTVGEDSNALDLSNTSSYLFESKSSYTGTGTLKGNFGALFEANNYGTGRIIENSALNIYSRNQGTGTIDTLYGIKVYTPINNGAITDSYGIYLGDFRKGSGSKYAIYSEGGDVRFNGALNVTGLTTLVGNVGVTGNVTVTGKINIPYSASNLYEIYTSNGSFRGSLIPFDNAGYMVFSSNYGGNGGGFNWKTENTSKMKMLENGNLGIGTETPTEKLHVNGKIKATSINFSGIPTSTTGLGSGDVWSDAGVLKIVS